MTMTTEHSKAISYLTNDWQSFKSIRKQSGMYFAAFQDLIWFGLAEEKREALCSNGIARGELIFIKLKTL